MHLTLEPYEVRPAALLPYDPRIAAVADALVARVRALAPFLEPLHIGSTSIPGMPGKGYIDIDLLTLAAEIPAVGRRLLEDGFQRQTGAHAFPDTRPMFRATVLVRDFLPSEGVTSPEAFRVLTHVHVTSDEKEVARDLIFRDALRQSPELRARYEARKREVLAQGISFGPDYARAKADVIVAILRELE